MPRFTDEELAAREKIAAGELPGGRHVTDLPEVQQRIADAAAARGYAMAEGMRPEGADPRAWANAVADGERLRAMQGGEDKARLAVHIMINGGSAISPDAVAASKPKGPPGIAQ